MASGYYKKWSKQEREYSARMTKRAAKLGWLRPVRCCEKCGQTKGILQMHNENYDVTIEILPEALERKPKPRISTEEKEAINEAIWILCWRCHMIHHSWYKNKAACKAYWAEVEAGKTYPPVYRHDWGILSRDHNI